MNDRLTQARLDELWDFGDPEASERRFREALAVAEPGSVLAEELATQLARALGLQERYDDGDAVLDSIGNGDPAVVTRVLLERGRLRNSSGHPDVAIPLFEEALAVAAAEGTDFLAVDAAHMLAIADPANAAHWIARALETVNESTDARTKRWAISLHNNLGSALASKKRYRGALVEFLLAADAAREVGTEQQRYWAQEAIDETLEAIEQMEQQGENTNVTE